MKSPQKIRRSTGGLSATLARYSFSCRSCARRVVSLTWSRWRHTTSISASPFGGLIRAAEWRTRHSERVSFFDFCGPLPLQWPGPAASIGRRERIAVLSRVIKW